MKIYECCNRRQKCEHLLVGRLRNGLGYCICGGMFLEVFDEEDDAWMNALTDVELLSSISAERSACHILNSVGAVKRLRALRHVLEMRALVVAY